MFGPVSVLPEYQGTGIGGALIELTMGKAARMGFKIVTITGNPQYYKQIWICQRRSEGHTHAGAPEGRGLSYFLVKEMENGALEGVSGCFEDPPGYITDPEEVDRFDKWFPPKQSSGCRDSLDTSRRPTMSEGDKMIIEDKAARLEAFEKMLILSGRITKILSAKWKN